MKTAERESESIRALKAAGGSFDGMAFNFSTFYLFAQRVAWGEAKEAEVEFMARLLDLIERRGDWNVAVNDYQG